MAENKQSPHGTFGSIFANFNFYVDCTSILPHSALFANDRTTCDPVVVCKCVCTCRSLFHVAKVLHRSLGAKVRCVCRRLGDTGRKNFILHSVV